MKNVSAPRPRRFAPWAIGAWLLLLVAAMGGVQYLRHGDHVYLAAAMVVIVVCAGCILRQAWSRMAMQVLAVLLASWALITAIMMWHHWGDFDQARRQAATHPQLRPVLDYLINRAQRTWEVSLALKALGIPFLLWLAWSLGRPTARADFGKQR